MTGAASFRRMLDSALQKPKPLVGGERKMLGVRKGPAERTTKESKVDVRYLSTVMGSRGKGESAGTSKPVHTETPNISVHDCCNSGTPILSVYEGERGYGQIGTKNLQQLGFGQYLIRWKRRDRGL